MSPKLEKVAMTRLRRSQFGGAGEIRTRDPLLAKQMLYQLSYDPKIGRLCCKELLVLDIYFVRSTGTRRLTSPSTMGRVTEVTAALSLKRR